MRWNTETIDLTSAFISSSAFDLRLNLFNVNTESLVESLDRLTCFNFGFVWPLTFPLTFVAVRSRAQRALLFTLPSDR